MSLRDKTKVDILGIGYIFEKYLARQISTLYTKYQVRRWKGNPTDLFFSQKSQTVIGPTINVLSILSILETNVRPPIQQGQTGSSSE